MDKADYNTVMDKLDVCHMPFREEGSRPAPRTPNAEKAMACIYDTQ